MDTEDETTSRTEAANSQMGSENGQIAHNDKREKPKWRQRSPAEQALGKMLIVLTLVSFLFVGVILNLIQLALTLSIRLSNNRTWRKWHKRLNGQIVYAVFAQPVFLLYAWPQWQLEIMLEDLQMMEDVKGRIFGIIIANHTFELDWMTCFLMADQLGQMGNYKCFSKDELKWLPIIGWTFWMADLIYVKRDWKQDRVHIGDKLDALLDYDQVLLGIFAEGTRWSPEKHDDAVAFARSRGLAPYKHHLFPRPRGFNYTLRHYLRRTTSEVELEQVGPIRLFNLEIVMPDRPRFKTFLEGGHLRASVYCEEVALGEELRQEALESRDEDDCPKLTKLLRDVYRRKDELVEEFEANGQRFAPKTARSGHFPVRSPERPFLYWLASMSLTYGTLLHLASTTFAGSLTFWALVASFLASATLLLRRIERESVPTKLRAGQESNRNGSAHELGDESQANSRQSSDGISTKADGQPMVRQRSLGHANHKPSECSLVNVADELAAKVSEETNNNKSSLAC